MGRPRDYIKLARPHQWAKGAFVLAGPFYGGVLLEAGAIQGVIAALIAFSLASSAVYVVNDIVDREQDQHHPRKKSRPIASGRIGVGPARVFSVLLVVGALLAVLAAPGHDARMRLGFITLVYVGNVLLYSAFLKRQVMLDALSLALGFVLRVLAGCAATGVTPSSWLLNSTLFLAIFLGLGKRLGERRTLREDADAARTVQKIYTDSLLRMGVSLAAVATLVTYAGYVQDQEARFLWSLFESLDEQGRPWGFNLLWLTVLPATYGLLRAIALLELGKYDDPTVLAIKDRGVQAAAFVFAALTAFALAMTGGVEGELTSGSDQPSASDTIESQPEQAVSDLPGVGVGSENLGE